MKILAAVDRSPFADLVTDMTRRVAASEPSKVLLLSVAPREPDLLGKQLKRKVITEPVPDELADRKNLLSSLAGLLEAAGIACETLMIRGEPAATIHHEAKRWGADLVVIGSHGRGLIKRRILGSVSEAIMRRAELPALIVFAPAAKLEEFTSEDTGG